MSARAPRKPGTGSAGGNGGPAACEGSWVQAWHVDVEAGRAGTWQGVLPPAPDFSRGEASDRAPPRYLFGEGGTAGSRRSPLRSAPRMGQAVGYARVSTVQQAAEGVLGRTLTESGRLMFGESLPCVFEALRPDHPRQGRAFASLHHAPGRECARGCGGPCEASTDPRVDAAHLRPPIAPRFHGGADGRRRWQEEMERPSLSLCAAWIGGRPPGSGSGRRVFRALRALAEHGETIPGQRGREMPSGLENST
jgi:hypothetical protein